MRDNLGKKVTNTRADWLIKATTFRLWRVPTVPSCMVTERALRCARRPAPTALGHSRPAHSRPVHPPLRCQSQGCPRPETPAESGEHRSAHARGEVSAAGAGGIRNSLQDVFREEGFVIDIGLFSFIILYLVLVLAPPTFGGPWGPEEQAWGSAQPRLQTWEQRSFQPHGVAPIMALDTGQPRAALCSS